MKSLSEFSETASMGMTHNLKSLFLVLSCLLCTVNTASAADWITLDSGLELAEFKVKKHAIVGDSVVTVLRADPDLWELTAVTSLGSEDPLGKSVKGWCEDQNLTAATNAGMFHPDRSHVGYFKIAGRVFQGAANEYLSAFAVNPLDSTRPQFRIYDLDETSLDSITGDYTTVCQNLRLIKRPGQNRWRQQDKMWSEAALGEDSLGRLLFIFCRTPYSMHDLNMILSSLPMGIIAAQHLEGGPEAQLFIRCEGQEIDLVGSYETGFNPNDENQRGWRVPAVIGLRKK